MKIAQAVRNGVALAVAFIATFMVTPKATAQFEKTPEAKNIILVHGAWADGSCWSKVIPILQAKGFHVTAVQLGLASLSNDVATVNRALALQDGPTILVGHSYGGVVIGEAGNDPKVVGLVYVAAFAPAPGQSAFDILAPYPSAPINSQLQLDASGFLSITEKGAFEDFGPDLLFSEKVLLAPTQGPTAEEVLKNATATIAAWRFKPTWFSISADDRVIPPALEQAEAEEMHATSITLHSSHLAMLSHPVEVAKLIDDAARGKR